MLSPFSVHRQSDYIYDESIIINGDGRIKVAMPMNGFQMIWNYRRTLGTHVRAPPNNTCLRLEWPLRNAWKWLARFPHEFRRLLLSAQLGTGLFCTKYKRKKKKFLSCALFYDGRHLSGGFVIYGRPGSTGGVGCGGVGGGGGIASFPLSMRLSSQLIN